MGSKKKEVKEKPLDKMTAVELRDVAKGIEGVVGASGMNKTELISIIRKERGIEEKAAKKGSDVREIKQKIKELKAKRVQILEADDQKMAAILRKRITRLKKKTRKTA